jgi:hypothetical protein
MLNKVTPVPAPAEAGQAFPQGGRSPKPILCSLKGALRSIIPFEGGLAFLYSPFERGLAFLHSPFEGGQGDVKE